MFIYFPTGRNIASTKHVISTSKRRGQKIIQSRCKRKPSPATMILANFFKMKAKADQLHSGVLSEKPAGDISSVPVDELRNWSTVTERKKMSTSLILFDEVNHLASLNCILFCIWFCIDFTVAVTVTPCRLM